VLKWCGWSVKEKKERARRDMNIMNNEPKKPGRENGVVEYWSIGRSKAGLGPIMGSGNGVMEYWSGVGNGVVERCPKWSIGVLGWGCPEDVDRSCTL
jgi:hypothetical protein